jgi:iron complex transport system ATP-binding protein
MPEVLLHLKELKVGYRTSGQEILLFENLNLVLKAGELICFMGPNGVGKSTLIKTIAGLHQPLFHSNAPQAVGKIDPKKISVVLTDRINAMNMSVRELVSYGRYPYLNWSAQLKEADLALVDKALGTVQLTELADKNINELSDGQLQLVMIARALTQDTPVILLDEPTAHLDLNNRVAIMNVLRKLSREMQKAILVSTHELDLALQTADLLWLADGKNILTGVPEDLVLDGSLDRIFQFKGFDLKTGKVFHQAHRGINVKLVGEGYTFLWTKNALERCGYEVTNQGDIEIEVLEGDGWKMGNTKIATLAQLLEQLP